ncbi:arginine deiminase family protein, partial [Klebsiella pneumoniae]|uniref:arginine deiminase family protein n=2 Tax=Bacteria TaxID=2 RepID=UPI0025A0E8D7
GRSERTTRARHVEGGLKEALGLALGLSSPQFIPCGGSNPGAAEVERTNNAISTLCLEPGKVCVYEENTETNK